MLFCRKSCAMAYVSLRQVSTAQCDQDFLRSFTESFHETYSIFIFNDFFFFFFFFAVL